jgi:hypothetical protein
VIDPPQGRPVGGGGSPRSWGYGGISPHLPDHTPGRIPGDLSPARDFRETWGIPPHPPYPGCMPFLGRLPRKKDGHRFVRWQDLPAGRWIHCPENASYRTPLKGKYFPDIRAYFSEIPDIRGLFRCGGHYGSRIVFTSAPCRETELYTCPDFHPSESDDNTGVFGNCGLSPSWGCGGDSPRDIPATSSKSSGPVQGFGEKSGP